VPSMIDEACLFCAEERDPTSARTFLSPNWPYPDRILFSNPSAFLVPGYSPQVYPYALLLPRRHTISMAKTTPGERTGAFACLQSLLDLRVGGSDTLYIFEHGGCINPSGSNACLDHAHYHVIPSTVDIFTDFVREKHPTPFTFSPQSTVEYERYLFAGIYQGGALVDGFIAESHLPERQYFRRLIARQIGDPRWNWRLGINEQYMLALKSVVDSGRRPE